MSKNALALVDCNTRDVLFQYIIETFDRKASKNEMVSPYDDQLIGKMNFRYNGMEHSMFFTYARSSEYPGKRFRNRKIMYLSLGVNEISSDIFNQICSTFGGFIDHNDDLEDGWQKVERIKVEDDPWQKAMEEANKAEPTPLDVRMEMRQLLKMEQDDEEDEERESKEGREKENRDNRRHRPDRRRGQADKGEKPEKTERNEKAERPEKGDQRAEQKADPKSNKKNEPKREVSERKEGQREERKEDRKDEQGRRPRNHHRGHRPRGLKKGDQRPEQKPDSKPEAKSNNG